MANNRLSQESPESYLKDVVSSIKFLSKNAKKQAFKRGIDVLTEIQSLKPYKGGIHEIRDIAREEFRAGIQRYLIGFFEDSIHHSTISVEMCLLIRLEETLLEEEKTMIHQKINGQPPFSFTFGAIFDESKRNNRQLINDKITEQRIAEIIVTRNTHIHAGNFTAASVLSMKQIGLQEIASGLEKFAKLERLEANPVVKTITKDFLPKAKDKLIETHNEITSLPSLEWCTRDKQREKAKEEIDDYFKEVFARANNIGDGMVSIADKVRAGLHSKELIQNMSADTYSKRKALETIHDSFEVLKSMGFISH